MTRPLRTPVGTDALHRGLKRSFLPVGLLALAWTPAFGQTAHRWMVFPDGDASRADVESIARRVVREYPDALLVEGEPSLVAELERAGSVRRRPLPGRLLLRGGAVAATPSAPASRVQGNGRVPVLVALAGPPEASWLRELVAGGAQVVGPVPPQGLLVRVEAPRVESLLALPFVAGVAPYEARWRLSPRVRAASGPGAAEVVLFEGEDRSRVLAAAGALGGDPRHLVLGGRRIVRATLDAEALRQIASLPEVEWVDLVGEAQLYNDRMRVVMQTEHASLLPMPPAFYNPVYNIGVLGAGQVIAVTDTGVLPTHEVFEEPGKIVAYYVPGDSCGTLGDLLYGHGTAVACTAAGDARGEVSLGFGTPNKYDGLAVGAQLVIQDIGNEPGADPVCLPTDVVADVFQQPYDDYGVRIHNVSWGHNAGNGTYSCLTKEIDQFLYDHPESVVAFAVSNAGSAPQTISDEAHSKNGIGVGACRSGHETQTMYTFSGRGPTSDGRIKPDVLAPGSPVTTADVPSDTAYFSGYFGTTFAAPAICGAAALIRDYFAQGFYPSGPDFEDPLGPSSALIKAMLVNAAIPLGGQGAHQSGSFYPNYDQGYGRPALDNVLEEAGYRSLRVFDGASMQVAQGELWTRNVTLGSTGSGRCRTLRATLVWTDPPPELCSGQALVNDLDLEVRVHGQTYVGNAGLTGGQADSSNNVEDVSLPLTDPTVNVEVRVLGTSVMVPPQRFALVVTHGVCLDRVPPECTGGGCYAGPTDTVPGAPPTYDPYACPGQDFGTDEFFGGSDPCDPGDMDGRLPGSDGGPVK